MAPRGQLCGLLHSIVLLSLGLASNAVTDAVGDRVILKGISYGPVPSKTLGGAPPIDDFMSTQYKPLWGDAGREDLAIMQKLGANAIRLYGNDPREDHKDFLDTAHKYGLQVIPGMSNFPFTDAPNNCRSTWWNCYSQLKDQFKDNLAKGFAEDGSYHPALKNVIIINEPDYKAPGLDHPELFTKAIISAFDGMLDAEKEANITGNLVKFTAAFSFGICKNCSKWNDKPALGQMYDLRAAMLDPSSVNYTANNDLTKAFETRWVNSLNVPVPAGVVDSLFLRHYKEEFKDNGTEVFIGEYHSYNDNQATDLPAILKMAEDPTNLLAGISFFEWQKAYNKGGSEEWFGMLGLGDHAIAQFSPYGKDSTVWCLTSVMDKHGSISLDSSLSNAYGGEGYDFTKDCVVNPSKVPVSADGFQEVLDQKNTVMMATFISHVVQHMGGTVSVEAADKEKLNEFATGYSGETRTAGSWGVLASKLGEKPDWVKWDPNAACVADRDASPETIGNAIGYACGQLGDTCSNAPSACSTAGTGAQADEADFVFSIYFNKISKAEDPLGNCNFGGAAMYAPTDVYRAIDRTCVVTNDPTTTPLSQEGFAEIVSLQDAGKLDAFVERIIQDRGESVDDQAALDKFVASVMSSPSLTFEQLEKQLSEQTFSCGGQTGRVCPAPTPSPPTPAPASPSPDSPTPAPSSDSTGLSPIVLGLLVIGALVVIGGGGFLAFRARTQQREFRPQENELASSGYGGHA